MILLIILAIAFFLYFWERTKDWAIKGEDQGYSNDPSENPLSVDKYKEEAKQQKKRKRNRR